MSLIGLVRTKHRLRCGTSSAVPHSSFAHAPTTACLRGLDFPGGRSGALAEDRSSVKKEHKNLSSICHEYVLTLSHILSIVSKLPGDSYDPDIPRPSRIHH